MKRFRTLLARASECLGRGAEPIPSVDDPELRVVVEAFDETEAASATLARSPLWHPSSPAVLRHHLLLPANEREDSEHVLEEEGWAVRPGGRGQEIPSDDSRRQGRDLLAVVALRVQHLDALRCSQESSRMAGLAQRGRGLSLGWDALQRQRTGGGGRSRS